jgi:hypothetical protein
MKPKNTRTKPRTQEIPIKPNPSCKIEVCHSLFLGALPLSTPLVCCTSVLPQCYLKSTPDWQTNTKTTEDFEWSSEQIITLLEFYSQYPQLWDTKHERYMNKDVRKQLISQLSELHIDLGAHGFGCT